MVLMHTKNNNTSSPLSSDISAPGLSDAQHHCVQHDSHPTTAYSNQQGTRLCDQLLDIVLATPSDACWGGCPGVRYMNEVHERGIWKKYLHKHNETFAKHTQTHTNINTPCGSSV